METRVRGGSEKRCPMSELIGVRFSQFIFGSFISPVEGNGGQARACYVLAAGFVRVWRKLWSRGLTWTLVFVYALVTASVR